MVGEREKQKGDTMGVRDLVKEKTKGDSMGVRDLGKERQNKTKRDSMGVRDLGKERLKNKKTKGDVMDLGIFERKCPCLLGFCRDLKYFLDLHI